MINIDINSPVAVVAAEAAELARRIFDNKFVAEGITKDRQKLLKWFQADASRDPRDISIPGAYLQSCYPVQHLTPGKVLAYAESHNLPLEECKRMINTICIPTTPSLKFMRGKRG